MTDDQSHSPTPKRSRLPSLRIMIVVALLLAVASVYFTVVVPCQRQLAALENIESSCGGVIHFEKVGPEWLRNWIGAERMRGFDRVTFIGLAGHKEVTDSTLRDISRLRSVEKLWLSDTSITDDGLMHLPCWDNLRELVLQGTSITGRGLDRFTTLEKLYVGQCCLNDNGLMCIARLSNLQVLNVDHLPLYSPSFEAIKDKSPLTDDYVKNITQLPNLESLSARFTPITDDGVKHLATLRKLNELNLAGTKISDASIPAFLALPQLKVLNVWRTHISNDGITSLVSRLPACKVYHN